MPSTPVIGNNELKEISELIAEDLGSGVVVFRNAFSVKDFILRHIDDCAAEAHKSRWSYVTDEDGVEYGINEDGFRYRLEDVPNAPVGSWSPLQRRQALKWSNTSPISRMRFTSA